MGMRAALANPSNHPVLHKWMMPFALEVVKILPGIASWFSDSIHGAVLIPEAEKYRLFEIWAQFFVQRSQGM
jgi:hypothetical protein